MVMKNAQFEFRKIYVIIVCCRDIYGRYRTFYKKQNATFLAV